MPALLAYHDTSVGIRFGKCCLDEMVWADKLLASVKGYGISHPQSES